MLNGNIKALRKTSGLSQQELAEKINVTRQTVSKWEQGLSVPDAEMLTELSKALNVPVCAVLNGKTEQTDVDDLRFALRRWRLRAGHRFFVAVCIVTAVIAAVLIPLQSPYLNWDYTHTETAVAGTLFNAFEWLFFRLAPFVLAGGAAGAVLTGRKLRLQARRQR